MGSDRVWHRLVGGWLGLFGADALLTIAAPLLASGIATSLLSALVPLVLLATFVTPRIPARVVVPPVLYLVWTGLGGMPVVLWVGLSTIVFGLLQLAVLALSLGMWWTLGPLSERPVTAWRRAGVLAAIGVLGGPLLLAGYTALSVRWGLHHITGGYAQLGLRGITSTERTFARAQTTVHLVGMAHVGSAEHYEALYDTFRAHPDAVVLAEGVSDEQGLLGEGPLYERMAGRVDLVQQPPIRGGDLTVRNADVDVSALSEETLKILSGAMEIWQADNPLIPYLSLVSSLSAEDPDELIDRLRFDLITMRNGVLLDALAVAEPEFTHLIVPWGAAHLPEIEAALLAEGWLETGAPLRRPLIGR